MINAFKQVKSSAAFKFLFGFSARRMLAGFVHIFMGLMSDFVLALIGFISLIYIASAWQHDYSRFIGGLAGLLLMLGILRLISRAIEGVADALDPVPSDAELVDRIKELIAQYDRQNKIVDDVTRLLESK